MKKILQLSSKKYLNLINKNKFSEFYGCCDRDYWSWKIKDFPNGTFQSGIAGLLDSKELSGLSEKDVERILTIVITGTQKIQRIDGSFEESYPYESSYCVTSLVIFFLLYTFFKYKKYFNNESKIVLNKIIIKSEIFLSKNKENHGLITNHIISAELAKELIKKFLKKEESELNHLLDLIDDNGQTIEYTGGDAAYQTLSNFYIISFLSIFPDHKSNKNLIKFLKSSFFFISNFCFPNGSFSDELGSRGSNIVYPAGMIFFNSKIKKWFIDKYLKNNFVNPQTVEDSNFTVLFNCWSFSYNNLQNLNFNFLNPKPNKKIVQTSDYLFINTKNDKTIVNINRGYIKMVKNLNGRFNSFICSGFFNKNYITQGCKVNLNRITENKFEIRLNKRKYFEKNNNYFYAIIIRIFSIIFFNSKNLKSLLKRTLTTFVIKRNQKSLETNIKITLSVNKQNTTIVIDNPDKWFPLDSMYYNHMAAANYYSS